MVATPQISAPHPGSDPGSLAVSGPPERGDYAQTRDRVEDYFDRTATRTWAALTSDAPVSRIRATVRAGRDRMRSVILGRLPDDLRGMRILDAGCGTGAMSEVLADRGADVVGVDISPRLLEIAEARVSGRMRARVAFIAGDMFSPSLGSFDAVVAQDSMIYYGAEDLVSNLTGLQERAGQIVFTVAPRTPLLSVMWNVGRLFPRSDRSPTMVPHKVERLADDLDAQVVERVTSGFYISTALEMRG